tara:strand:- start:550 stop:1527 length:978 start_codon:yes stop_codon:yes gene_type:complete
MKKDNTMKIGVIGVGHLGNFHLKQLLEIPHISISGIYDSDKSRLEEISNIYNVKPFLSLEKLLTISHAVSIVTPTIHHYAIADLALDHDCHIFIEKPITNNIQDARLLLNKSEKYNKIIQVGHIERFNPAFSILKKSNLEPRFIECHRLAEFNVRGNDVPVILDLMIHDLDIILSLVKSDIKNIYANGVRVISSSEDIANARIEFSNGCIANLTASRISQKTMRKMRLFQEKEYISVDFQNGILEKYKIYDNLPNEITNKVVEIGEDEKKYIAYSKPPVQKSDALKEELLHFIESIKKSQKPDTDGKSAIDALSLALEIQKIIGK